MNKFWVLAAALMFAGQASALSLGTISGQEERSTSGDSAEFKVEVYNPGSEPVQIEISSSVESGDASDVRVAHPSSVELEGSRITSTPVGSGWFAMGNGKYIKLREIPVEVYRSNAGVRGEYDVSVTLRATSESLSSSDISQKVAWERQFRFTADFEPLDENEIERNRESATPPGSFSGGSSSSGTTGSSGGSLGGGVRSSVGSAVGAAQNFVSGAVGGSTGGSSAPEPAQEDSSGEPGESVGSSEASEDEAGDEQEGGNELDELQETERDPASEPAPSPATSSTTTGGFASGVTSTTGMLVIGTLLSLSYLLKVVILA